jgi:ribosomal protein S18 acetylase RimI-like enzyme
MEITRMTSCSDTEFQQIEALIGVLSHTCKANREIIDEVLSKEDSHLFIAKDKECRIVGMATVCCFTIPTGRHATIEDVVVLPECQGTGLGRRLVEATLDYLRSTGQSYKVGLTSKPSRIAANALYRKMGFKQKETNVYTLDV